MEARRGGCAARSSLLVVAGTVVLAAACGGDDSTSGQPSSPLVTADAATSTSTPTLPTSPSESEPIASDRIPASTPARADLRSGLVAAGAAIDSAPADVVASLQDPLCGTVLSDQPAAHDSASIQCLLDATEEGRRAALVIVVFTTEGDPLVEVWLSHAAGMSLAVDTTRDEFGRAGWRSRACGNVTTTAAGDPWTSPLQCT